MNNALICHPISPSPTFSYNSPATWALANPALGDFRSRSDVERQAAQAKRMPAREQSFRNLILNQRVDAHVRFLAKAEWDANAGPVDYASLAGRVCYGGLDLSQSRDLTAYVLVFPREDGTFDVLCRFFLPEHGIEDKSDLDRVPYALWARQGFLTLIPGSTIDATVVAEAIAESCQVYDVKRIGYDRWRIEYLKRDLARIGVEPPLEPFGQGFHDMAPAVDRLEREVAETRLHHGGNPILTHCASNSVIEMNPSGDRKLAKNKSSGRIDGMVALAMALGVVDREEDTSLPACLADLLQ